MNLLVSMRYLVALHEYQHFGRAALACHITQPALSNALKALEDELSVSLVKRGRNYAGLTPEGERVLAVAQRLLHEQEVLKQDLRSQVDAPQGVLRIGSVPAAIPVVARFAALLNKRQPGIRPLVLSLSSAELEAGLEDLSLDMALGYPDRLPGLEQRFAFCPQYQEHYFLVRRTQGSSGRRFQIGATLTWAQAAQFPLCLFTPDMHNRTIVNAAFAQSNVSVQAAVETNSILTMALSVVEGRLCSVMPGALVAAYRNYPGLEALPLINPIVTTRIGFMTHPSARPSRALQSALAFAQESHWLEHLKQHSGDLAQK